MRLLLLSNSTNHDAGYLEHALETVLEHLGGARLLFVPYALADHDAYLATVAGALEPAGVAVDGLHRADDPVDAIHRAEAVFVGGGSTFRLLRDLRALGLLAPLAARVRAGMPYMGASAGTNVAGPSIRTTNDMPITDPGGFDALGLVPMQLNPHYLDADPTSTHRGETRAQRIAEFHEESDVPVLGLREGTWLAVRDAVATIGGRAVGASAPGPALVFARGAEPREVQGDVSWLLEDPRRTR